MVGYQVSSLSIYVNFFVSHKMRIEGTLDVVGVLPLDDSCENNTNFLTKFGG